jgi:hypothetical protein
MTNFLTTSEERDQFLQWLESQKDEARIHRATDNRTLEYWHNRGRYEAYLEVLAYVKTGGKL